MKATYAELQAMPLPRRVLRIVRDGWPIYMATAVAMFALGLAQARGWL